MSQISKCPKLRVVLGYWEALGEVSELRYKNLLYSSYQRSYNSCTSTTKISSFEETFYLSSKTGEVFFSPARHFVRFGYEPVQLCSQ